MSRYKTFTKPLFGTFSAALLAGSIAAASAAQGDLQGLYSADELLDADVYSSANPAESIGEVEDILLDDDMRVHALVIDTGNLLDMGEKQYVIETGQFSVETLNDRSLDRLEYRVTVDLSEQEITRQPAYTDSWWNEAKQGAKDAWQRTKEGASSAWQKTKEGTADMLDRAEQALDSSNSGKTTTK